MRLAICLLIGMFLGTAAYGDDVYEDDVLDLSFDQAGDLFGAAIAMDGDVAAVGLPYHMAGYGLEQGAVVTYRFDGNEWVATGTLTAPSSPAPVYYHFGTSVAISGEWLMVGCPGQGDPGEDTGRVYVYKMIGQSWNWQSTLSPGEPSWNEIPDWEFGASVSIDGDWAAIGAPCSSCNSTAQGGEVYLYRRSGAGNWTFHHLITNEEGYADKFGYSVSIAVGSGYFRRVLVGEPGENAAHVYLFDNKGSIALEETLFASDAVGQEQFGLSVDLNAGMDIAVVGGPTAGSTHPTGQAYVFRWKDMDVFWEEEAILTPGDTGGYGHYFGHSVAVSGNMILVGAPNESSLDPQSPSSAHLYRYRAITGEWVEEARLLPSEGVEDDKFGYAVATDGTHALIGSPGKRWAGVDGLTYVFDVAVPADGDRYWVNENGGSFQDPVNWWYEQVPTKLNHTIFDLEANFGFDAQYTLGFDDDASSLTLKVRGDDVTLDLDGHNFELAALFEPGLVLGENYGDDGSLTIEDGAMTLNSGVIGMMPGVNCALILAGDTSSTTILTDLYVGFTGQATMDIQEGAYLLSRNAIVGAMPGSWGHVTLRDQGTRWDLPFYLVVEQGVLEVHDGAEIAAGSISTIFQNGWLTGDGDVASDLVNYGQVEPFLSSSPLHIHGDYEQVGEIPGLGSGTGTFRAQIGSVDHSELVVTGTAVLGGGLVVKSPGYDPGADESFRLISAEWLEGQIDVSLMPGLSDGKYMKLTYGAPPLRGGLGGVDVEVDVFNDLLGFDDPTSVPIDGAPTSALVDDLSGDGLDDVAITLAGVDETSPGSLLVLISDGSGGFASSQQIAVDADPRDVTAGDFDADGTLDLAVACAGSDSVAVVENLDLGDGQFGAAWSFATGASPRGITATHVNDDGVIDLAVACYDDDAVLLHAATSGLGGMGFGGGQEIPVGAGPSGIDPGDVGDTKDLEKDVIVGNTGDGTVSLLRKGGGLVGEGWTVDTYSVGEMPLSVDMADLNEDGFDDAVVTNYGDGTVSVLLSTGDGFMPQVALPVGESPTSMTIVDFDNDGDRDIAVVAGNEDGDRVVQVLRNDYNLTGDLIFAAAEQLAENESPALVQSGDLDGDKMVDLVTVSSAESFMGGSVADLTVRQNANKQLPCFGDLDGNGYVGAGDLLLVIEAWGPCEACPADLDDDGMVRVSDLLLVIDAWGPCS